MTEQPCSGQKKPKVSDRNIAVKPIWATVVQTMRDSFGGRPNTVLYPDERLVLPDRYRGKHKVSYTRCIGCSQCVNICPNDCMWMQKIEDPVLGKIERPGVDYARCLFCGLCVDICPTDAIIETSEFELSAYDRKGLKYGPEQLRDDNCVVKEPKESVLIPVLDLDLCKARGDCVKACPANCITMIEMQKTGKKRPEVDLSACIHCEKCVLACPEKAFKMEKRLEVMYERPIPDFKLDTCTGCGACAKVCPVDAIYMVDMPGTEKKKADGTMTKPKKRAVFILEKCIGCSRCSKACKFSTIEMIPESRFKGVMR